MENVVTTTVSEVKSFRIQLEKLDGGFVSDVSGKRKIYQHADEIVDMINMNSVLGKLGHDVYHLNIDLVPKDKMEDYMDLVALHGAEEEVLSYDKAKELGIIQGADKFDPNIHTENTIEKVIKVTAANAYHASRLKTIDWKYFDEQLPMTNTERTEIGGISAQAMYNQWRKAKEGKASFHQVATRVAFTILAKYYEANLGVRTSTKDNLDMLKEQMLNALRELELIACKSKFTKSTEINKKITEMRKHLL